MQDERNSSRALASIVIPTLNSQRNLEACLQAIESQEYAPIEVVVVDGGSSDGTISIAERHKVILVSGHHSLLESRCIGIEYSKGDPVILLDSDQYLEPDAVRQALHLLETYDMVFLGENSQSTHSRLSRLYHADREFVHKIQEFDPLKSTLLPRVFKRRVIVQAIEAIPRPLISRVVGLDHAIIYLEAYRVSSRVALLPAAVRHDEPIDVSTLIRKNFRYGRADAAVLSCSKYRRLLLSKMRPRAGIWTAENTRFAVASAALLAAKSIPYLTGFVIGVLTNLKNPGLR